MLDLGRTSSILIVLALLGALAAARWRHRTALAAAPAHIASTPVDDTPAANVRRAPRAGEEPPRPSDGVPGRGRVHVTWAPAPDDVWSRARAPIAASIAPLAAQRALARAVPPEEPGAELGPSFGPYLVQAPAAARAPYGKVDHLADGTLRVVDGVPDRVGWAQVELRITRGDDTASPTAEVAVFGAHSDGALEPWTVADAQLALERAPLAEAVEPRTLLARYTLHARDAEGEEHALAGLIEIALR